MGDISFITAKIALHF